jgi:hypothetical protein
VRAAGVLASLALVAAALACVKSSKPCYLGDYNGCLCADGGYGYQACAPSEDGFGTCICDGTTPGLDAGVDAAPPREAGSGGGHRDAGDAGDASDDDAEPSDAALVEGG